MLVIPPPKYQKGHRLARRRNQEVFHDGMLFQAASVSDPDNRAYFLAAGDMVWNGTDLPATITAMTSNGVMESPIAVISVSADLMELEFPASLALGAAWAVVGPVAGITPAIAWPQAGTLG